MIKKVLLKDVPDGTTIEVFGREFTVLDATTQGILVLQNNIEIAMPFQDDEDVIQMNDYRRSSIKEFLDSEYINRLKAAGAKDDDLCQFDIDLKCTMGVHEYGSVNVTAGLLTLE